MKRAEKVIITCAVTGSIHTPSMSPYLPVTADQIASQAIEAAEAGASILHLHARDPADGRPTQEPSRFMEFLPRIKQATNAVVNITTGGGMGMTLEQRVAPALAARAELASLNMGSMNFGAWELAEKPRRWHHAWEKDYLTNTYSSVYPNTFQMIDEVISTLGDGCGTRFEFECYDLSHLYNLDYFVRQGRLKPPFLIQCVLGVRGGIGADAENLLHMRQIADKLFGDDYYLSCLAVGREQLSLLKLSARLGGCVRVGLEDNLYLSAGQLARSNSEQVGNIRAILEGAGLTVATPDEARTMLSLKGAEEVAF